MKPSFLILLIALLLPGCSKSDDKTNNAGLAGGLLSLTLRVVQPTIAQGSVPAFELRVRNQGKTPLRVLDTRTRLDLQYTYYELIVTRDGEDVDVPIAIADPGPLSPEVYRSLGPGGTHSVALTRFPRAFDQLDPGGYEAVVLFWQDPILPKATRRPSNRVQFTVAPSALER